MLTLLKFLDYSGTIKIGGQDIRTVSHEFLRERLVSISQEGIELDGSLRKNLDPYDAPDLSHRLHDETLIDVLERACLWKSIESRGFCLNTPLQDLKLSTGQLQLLAVALAMLRREYNSSRIMLIDEAICNVDDETAKKVQAAMAASFTNCTVITIAHRLETVEDCGLVIKMDAGKISRTLDRRQAHGTASIRSQASGGLHESQVSQAVP